MELGNCSARFYDRLYLNDVLGLGIAQQCISIWELRSNVLRRGIPQQCVRIGYSSVCMEIGNWSAMFYDRLYLNDVLGLGIAQQCIST